MTLSRRSSTTSGHSTSSSSGVDVASKAMAACELLRVAQQMVDGSSPALQALLEKDTRVAEDVEALVSALQGLLVAPAKTLEGAEVGGDGGQQQDTSGGVPSSSTTTSTSSSPFAILKRLSGASDDTLLATGAGAGGSSAAGTLSPRSSLGGVLGGLYIPGLAASAQVLHDQAMLLEVMSYLVAPSKDGRAQLGVLALVSKGWKELATSDTFWRAVSIDLFPAWPGAFAAAGGGGKAAPPPAAAAAGVGLPAGAFSFQGSNNAATATTSAAASSLRVACRAHVLCYGKALGTPRYSTTSAWQEGLSMVYEVTDQADGRRLFYGAGPIHVAVGQNVILRLAGVHRHETSMPFSAVDRDPGQERFPTARDFFKTCHGAQYPASLRIRVVICDQRTGKMALLYQSGKASKRHAKSPNASYWQDFLPDDSLYIWDADSVVFGKEGQVKLAAAFYVVAVEGQDEDVDDKERLYRIAGGDTERYQQHSSYVSLDFSCTDGEAVGRFIKSLFKD